MTKHVEVHLFKRTDADLELAIAAGLLERDENIICDICNSGLLFIYVLLGDTAKSVSCEDCLKVALARVMV
jgi:hypothetical protein